MAASEVVKRLSGAKVAAVTGDDITGRISHLACIGEPPEHREYRWQYLKGTASYYFPVIENSAIVEAFATVDGGIHEPTYIGERVLLMKHSHVGHDAIIQDDCNIAPGAVIGGHCALGAGVKIGLGALIRPRVRIGEGAVIGAGAVVVTNVPAGETWAGNPARNLKDRKGSETDRDIWLDWYETWH